MIHKYTADEARNLKTYGELKSDFTIHEAAQGDGGECEGRTARINTKSSSLGEGSDVEEGGVEFGEAEIDDI